MQTDFLSELEKQRLEVALEDRVAIEAIRKVILSAIYQDGTLTAGVSAKPQENFAFLLGGLPELSDEKIGKHLRACIEAVRMMENGFTRLQRYRKLEEKEPEINKGR